MSARTHRSTRGFSLIELMVALTIGTLVTIGIVSILSSMKRNSTSQTGLATLQDNERIAMNLVTAMVQTAGYYPYGQSPSTLFPVTGTPAFTTAGQYITGANVSSGIDSISVRYVTIGTSTFGSDAAINCAGNTSASQQTFTNTVTISGGVLVCTPIVSGVTGTSVSLVTGVCGMTILYGVHSGSVNNNSADAYINAAAVTAGTYWSKVLSVKVTLSFANPLANPLGGTPCTSTLPQVTLTRVITVMNNTGVNS